MSAPATLVELLAQLSRAGVKLWAEDGSLCVSAPRGRLTPELQRAIAAHKAELLTLVADGPGELRAEGLPALVARPAERAEPFPLTDMQQAYWVGRGGSVELGHAIHVYLEIDSVELDVARFADAWNGLVARHEMLRAVAGDDATQRILPEVPRYAIEVEDLRGLAPEAAAARLEALRERLTHQVLPLDRWPLFEVRAARLEGRTRLCFSIDCTFVDSWSLQILFRELLARYDDPAARLDPEHHTLSFRDYVLAAGQVRDSEAYRRSLAYWQQRIPSLPPPPELPMVAPARGRPRFGRWVARLDRAEWQRVKAAAGQLGVTQTGLLLTAYAEVLAHFSKSPRFTINVPLYNRLPLHPDVGKAVGTFSSFTLLEVEHDPRASFGERARALQAQLWRDLEHRQIGGVEVLRQMSRARGKIVGAPMPVVLTSFAGGVNGWDSCWIDHLGRRFGEVVYAVTQTPQTWIDHQVLFQDGGLFYNWDAASDLFAPGLIDEMFGAYGRLLGQLARDPAAAVALTPPVRCAGPAAAPPRLLHDRFLAHAAASPRAPAVIAPHRTLSYGELRDRAAALACELRRLGAGQARPVAVVMEKGWEQVVAVLAAALAGAPYLPIDAEAPAERRLHLLRQGRVAAILTQASLDRARSWPEELPRIAVDEAAAGPPAGAPAPPALAPDELAAIIYTSGSTGTPAGVRLTHRGLANAIDDTLREFALAPSDRVLALTALHHDMSIFDVFGLLSAGGALVMPERGTRRDPAHWAELIRRHGVTVWCSVPAMMEMLLAHAGARAELQPRSLRLAFLGGDWIRTDLPDRLRAAADAVTVVSVGGPTETSLWNIWYRIGEVDPTWSSIPYGRPIAGATYHVMDEALRERPVWVAGELCCAGVGVAAGYLDDPERTARKFVVHPRTGERLYRTGDLGRLRADGNLEILGRIDHQISILGHRVEPGEIEAALARHPEVAAAVVVAAGGRHDPRLVAYVVAAPGADPSPQALAVFVAGKLPAHMVPQVFHRLERLPLGATGKIDRAALPPVPAQPPAPEPEAAPEAAPDAAPAAVDASDAAVERLVQEVLGVEAIDRRTNFFELGANSVTLVRLSARLRDALGIDLPVVELFEHPTVEFLSERVRRRAAPAPAAPRPSPRGAADAARGPIAIIGMTGRFPGAADLEQFWRNLVTGVESVRRFTDDELRAEGLPEAMLRDPRYVRAGAVLDDLAGFDAGLFGLSAREAELTDPQQRLFLECAWEALEDAGYAPGDHGPTIGVYAGKSLSNYLYPELDLTAPIAYFQQLFGNDKDFIATQVSYRLNLRGPSLCVQSACSTSLVAIALACQGLWSGDCELALAGGVALKVPHRLGYLVDADAGMLSPDGHCRPFDARAAGIVPGSGAGVVVLKPLAAAERDGDAIRAVVLGAALNNDGARKAGFSAPSQRAQADVVARAHERAGVDPATIGYVEAHGTGTPIGDPIEVAALTESFRRGTDKLGYCALGSVKSNIGHLDTAAGVAGLIKAVLALEHGVVPPTLHFERPNPAIDFARTPFFVPAQLRPWPDEPRRAGVSSFGVGGTNAHVVLEAAPARAPAEPSPRPVHLLALSARSDEALAALARRYEAALRARPGLDAADVCFTAHEGRTHFEHRLAVCGADPAALADRLADALAGGAAAGVARGRVDAAPIAFLFPGHGAAYPGMGRDLHETQPVFRDAIGRCDAILRRHLARPLREVLYGADAGLLAEIPYAQAALFAVEYALAEVWRSWGVEPAAVLGHSLGEYVAACVAGVFELDDALQLVTTRAHLIVRDGGVGDTVLALAGEDEVRRALAPHGARAAIASFNTPTSVVISGESAAVAAVSAALAAAGVEVKRLDATRAAHSPLMDPVLPAFARAAEAVRYAAPRIAVASNLSGEVAGREMASADYWCRQLREPVRLAAGMAALAAQGARIFLEVGPKPTLMWMGQECLPELPAAWLPSLRKGRSDWAQMMETLGALYCRGVAIRWAGLAAGEARRRVALPSYPFERKRYWSADAPSRLERGAPAQARRAAAAGAGSPLHGAPVRSAALRDGEALFECRLGRGSPGYLEHHQAFGAVIVPATAYVEMALAAGAALLGADALVLTDVAFTRALILPEAGERVVQILAAPAPGGHALRILALEDEAEADGAAPGWILHASAHVARAEAAGPAARAGSDAASSAGEALDETIDGATHYARARAQGVEFGAAFRGVASIRRGAASARGDVVAPPSVAGELDRHHAHPALLDSCLQVASAVVPAAGPDELLVPAAIARLVRWAALPPRAACVATPAGAARADVSVLGADDREVLRVEGLELRRVPRDAWLGAREVTARWLHEPIWTERARGDAAARGAGETWLVVADAASRPLAEELAELARARGGGCTIAIDPTDAAELRRLVAELDRSRGPLGQVVLLAGDAAAAGAPESAAELAGAALQLTGRAVLLAQALLGGAGAAPPRLAFVRRAGALASAPLVGLARGIACEHPELGARVIELPAEAAPDARELLAELGASDGEARVALGASRRVSRLAEVRAPSAATAVRADATYLITGGLGRLGRLVAQTLAERGARHLVLLGRRPGAAPELPGVAIRVVAADVARLDELRAALAAIDAAGPPLRGLVHCAGVIEDALVQRETPGGLERVLAPKVAGALHLHLLTAGRELDFFTLFSSAASLLGTAGQAGYAAANAFLDALALHRRALGLPGLSLAWGPWSGEAAAAGDAAAERLARRGLGMIAPAHGAAIFARMLGAGGVYGVLPIDRAGIEAGAGAPVLAELASAPPRPARSTPGSLLDGAPVVERRALLDALVREQCAALVGLPPADLDPDRGLFEMGLDSLGALELRNRLQTVLGRALPATLVFNHPTLERLSAHLAERVLAPPAAAPAAPPEPAEARPAAAPAAGALDGLSEEELMRRLEERLDR